MTNIMIDKISRKSLEQFTDFVNQFHDSKVLAYTMYDDNRFCVAMLRPYFEAPIPKKFLGLFPYKKIPLINTIIEFSNLDKVSQRENDSSDGSDWFLNVDFDLDKMELYFDGVFNKYTLKITPETTIQVGSHAGYKDVAGKQSDIFPQKKSD